LAFFPVGSAFMWQLSMWHLFLSTLQATAQRPALWPALALPPPPAWQGLPQLAAEAALICDANFAHAHQPDCGVVLCIHHVARQQFSIGAQDHGPLGALVRAGRPWGVCALAGELLAAKWEQCAASRATDVTSL